MTYVDVDGNAATFNSSEARLSLPDGARVLFAGLYYGGRLAAGTGGAPAPNPGAANTLKLQPPDADTYTDLVASAPLDTAGQTYQGFVDVTDEVRAAGAGVYRVANVQAGTGRSDGQLAGWSLVVAYADPAAPTRNLSIFDGLQNVASGSPGVTIGLSGFRTPATGAVNSTVGLVAYEGDLGTTGDGASIRNGTGGFTALSNGANPATNLFTSSITANAANVGDRSPNYPNNLGFDADLFALPGVLGNNQTSTEVRLTTSGDAYQPGVVTIATDLYAPRIEAPKTVDADVADAGQLLTYTIPVSNAGEEAASDVVLTDAIPADTTYVPGSLRIDGAVQTDGPGDDRGEVAGGTLTARLGTGANATAGGLLASGATPTTVSFQVRVDATVPPETMIRNVARIAFSSLATGDSFVDTAPAETRIRTPQVDLALAKEVTSTSAAPFGYGPYEEIRYRLTVRNDGSVPAPAVVLDDSLPPPMELQSSEASQGSCTGTTCNLGTLGAGASATVTLTAVVPGDLTTFPPQATFANTARVTSGGVDTNAENNEASAEIVTSPVADVAITKTFQPAEPLAGGPVVYTLEVENRGPSAVDVNVGDLVPAELGTDWTIELVAGGTGACDKGTLPDAPPDLVLGLCQIPRMEVGGRRTIEVRGTLARDSAGTTVTNVTAASPDALDDYSNNTNNRDEVSFVPRRVDLAFTKTRLEDGPVLVGGETTFRLSATNNGDGTATGVTLRDELPAGLTPLGPPAGCVVTGQVVDCAVGALGPGVSASFDVRARAEESVAGRTLVNRGQALTVSPDLDASNNAAQVEVPIGPAPPRPTPSNDDLAIRVLAPKGPVRVGQATRWRLEVTNAGPATATGVRVTATPRRGTILPGARVAQAGCASASPTSCSLETLALGARRTIALSIRPARTGTLTLTGTVRGNEPETRTDNNTDSGSVRVLEGLTSLRLSVRADARVARAGRPLRLTLVVRNTGRRAAERVTVCQRLPGGLLPARLGGARLRAGVPCWTLRRLAAGASRRFTITVRPACLTRTVTTTGSARADNARERLAAVRLRLACAARAPRFTG